MIGSHASLTRAAAFLAALGITAFFPVHAQKQSNLVVVLDGSGSMWGRIQGDQMKIVEAKKVTRELLEDVPPEVNLGFVVYGHRRKGDCADIETIAPLGTEPSAIAAAVEAIVPRGKTPITDSLRHAAGLLSGTDNPSTLVLVSDGIETCRGDPCALARELKAGGIDLVIHTVGFGVGDEAASQLQCVAEAGGGNYYHVTDGNQLRDALFAVREAVAEREPPPPPPVQPQPEQQQSASTTVILIGPGTIELEPASWVQMEPYYWKIVDPETGEDKGQAKEKHMKVRAGEYQLVWRQTRFKNNDVPLAEIVSVPAGKTVKVPIDTGLQIAVPEGMPPPWRWWLRREGMDEPFATFSETLDPQVIPAGRYQLGWHQYRFESPAVPIGRVEVQPGQLNHYVADHGFQVRPAQWVNTEELWGIWLVDDDGTELGPWQTFETHLAPPGQYTVRYQQTRFRHSPVTWGSIEITEESFAAIDVNSGVRFKAQAVTTPPYRAYFVNLDSGEEVWWGGAKEWEAIPLPPGRYRLDWWEKRFETQRMTLLDEFAVKPGALIEFQM